MSVKLEKEFVSDRTKLILEYLNYSDSSMSELIESDLPSKKLQYPIKRVSFQISYDLALIDKMEGFEFERYVGKLFQKFDDSIGDLN